MKNYSYWQIMILVILSLIIGDFIIGGMSMDKGVGKFRYSYSLGEAMNQKTIINTYIVLDENRKQISEAWLEYARSYNIFDRKKIEKDKVLLSIANVKEFEEIENIYWEAFFKNKKLTAFQDKEIISVIGVNEKMDTIKLKSDKSGIFYIVKVSNFSKE